MNSVEKILTLKEHYKAIGMFNHYIYEKDIGDFNTFPWNIFNKIEVGGAYRLGIPISMLFTGTKDEMHFRLFIDFEKAKANGSGTFQFDVEKLEKLLKVIPVHLRYELARFVKNDMRNGVLENERKQYEYYKLAKDSLAIVDRMISVIEGK